MGVKGLNEETFSFSSIYQRDIIATMIQKPELYTRVGTQIEPKYFELKEYKDIYKTIKNYYDEYIALPSKDVLKELVSRVNDDKNVLLDIDDIYDKKIKDSDTKQIEADVVQFISYQAMKKSVMSCVDLLNDPDNYNQMKNEIDKALIVGQSMIDTGTDGYSDEAIINRYCNDEKEEQQYISTGWNELDDILGGGWSRKTMSSVMGVSNAGKSNYLINFCANALLQQKNCLYVSLEMDESVILQRMDARLLGVDQKQIRDKDSVVVSKLKELLEERIGKFYVKQFPANTISCDDIVTFIDRLENVNNIKIDMLALDYCDIMKSSKSYTERRSELDSIYVEARNIALTKNIVVLTCTQLNRAGLTATKAGQIVDAEYIAGNFGNIRTLDTALFLNVTPQDLKNKTSILYVGKNRNGEVGAQIRLYTDYSKCLIKPWTEVKQQSTNNNTLVANQNQNSQENKIKSLFEN